MTGTVTDLAVRSLAGLVDLDVERTQYRGHARELAAAARGELVIVLGGDGSVNEVVNGVMGRDGGGSGPAACRGPPGECVAVRADDHASALPWHRPAQAGLDAGTRRPAAGRRPVHDHRHEPLAVDLSP